MKRERVGGERRRGGRRRGREWRGEEERGSGYCCVLRARLVFSLGGGGQKNAKCVRSKACGYVKNRRNRRNSELHPFHTLSPR